jgi:virginiamycin B lyase
MRKLILLAAAGLMAVPSSLAAQAARNVDLKEWPVEHGGRTRDPYVAPDGKVWFVGQAGNYIANLDPTTGAVKRYEIEEGTNPHTLIVNDDGIVWYAGNRNGRIGRLDPATGQIKTIMTGEARDPHTMHFDGKGNIWFTSQGASRIGRLNMATEKVDIVNPVPDRTEGVNPYGMDLDPQGRAWVSLFRTNMLAMVDPNTLEVKLFPTAEGGRIRRNAVTSDGMVWYVDYQRGFVGRLDPATGQYKEWQSPGGPTSRPYAITVDDQDRLWVSETPGGGAPQRLVGFDPKSERFFSISDVSGGVRNMFFHKETGTLWFGTDANNVGRIVTRAILP